MAGAADAVADGAMGVVALWHYGSAILVG